MLGLTRVEGRLRGDVDFEAVRKLAGVHTPVPGGVGANDSRMLAGKHSPSSHPPD